MRVVYLGAHEGCGCGFSFNEYPEHEEPDEVAASKISAANLADYLESLLGSESELQLYPCWDGEQHLPQSETQTLYPSQLRQNAFWFEERSFYRVLRARFPLDHTTW